MDLKVYADLGYRPYRIAYMDVWCCQGVLWFKVNVWGKLRLTDWLAVLGRGQLSWESHGLVHRQPTTNSVEWNIWTSVTTSTRFKTRVLRRISKLFLCCLSRVTCHFSTCANDLIEEYEINGCIVFLISNSLTDPLPLSEYKQDSGYLSHILPLGWVCVMSLFLILDLYRDSSPMLSCVVVLGPSCTMCLRPTGQG